MNDPIAEFPLRGAALSTSFPKLMNNMSNEPLKIPTPWIDLGLRLFSLVALLLLSTRILFPFLSAVLWGAVLAVALYPLFARLNKLFGQRPKFTAALFVLVPLVLLTAPTIILAQHLISDISDLNRAYHAGTWNIPPPPASMVTWPVVGKAISSAWQAAYDDLPGTLTRLAPQLAELQDALLQTARSTVTGLIKSFFSLIVMATFFVSAQKTEGAVRALMLRVAGQEGHRLFSLARDTIRSVSRGIVGVAAIQAIMGGVACLLAGVPGAGIWAVVMLILAVAQLPVALVMLPIAGYLFLTGPLWIAIVFLVWSIAVSTIDNVLKPLLLGKGVDAPLLVIFLGAIGGLLSAGVIGLFLGPVILVLTYTLVTLWAKSTPSNPPALS